MDFGSTFTVRGLRTTDHVHTAFRAVSEPQINTNNIKSFLHVLRATVVAKAGFQVV